MLLNELEDQLLRSKSRALPELNVSDLKDIVHSINTKLKDRDRGEKSGCRSNKLPGCWDCSSYLSAILHFIRLTVERNSRITDRMKRQLTAFRRTAADLNTCAILENTNSSAGGGGYLPGWSVGHFTSPSIFSDINIVTTYQ
jgi:hypothetical protein